ncbi:hypothetical protein BDZ91DRAFT_792078 [Kalaharituber pfeilii]|nr:hypothetical protein BDZ91DRAFT_792078 [Kalaharituber pfeilii]
MCYSTPCAACPRDTNDSSYVSSPTPCLLCSPYYESCAQGQPPLRYRLDDEWSTVPTRPRSALGGMLNRGGGEEIWDEVCERYHQGVNSWQKRAEQRGEKGPTRGSTADISLPPTPTTILSSPSSEVASVSPFIFEGEDEEGEVTVRTLTLTLSPPPVPPSRRFPAVDIRAGTQNHDSRYLPLQTPTQLFLDPSLSPSVWSLASISTIPTISTTQKPPALATITSFFKSFLSTISTLSLPTLKVAFYYLLPTLLLFPPYILFLIWFISIVVLAPVDSEQYAEYAFSRTDGTGPGEGAVASGIALAYAVVGSMVNHVVVGRVWRGRAKQWGRGRLEKSEGEARRGIGGSGERVKNIQEGLTMRIWRLGRLLERKKREEEMGEKGIVEGESEGSRKVDEEEGAEREMKGGDRKRKMGMGIGMEKCVRVMLCTGFAVLWAFMVPGVVGMGVAAVVRLTRDAVVME